MSRYSAGVARGRLAVPGVIFGMLLLSGAAPASEDNDMTTEQAVEGEIVALHEFFQDWYRGVLARDAFDRFENALAPDFVIVNPDARALERGAILEAVRDAFGSDPEARLWIDNVAIRQRAGDVLTATYEEWQALAGKPARARLSTVVLRADAAAPGGWRWLHVHETWMPAGRE